MTFDKKTAQILDGVEGSRVNDDKSKIKMKEGRT